jgi:hypothetical protein
MSLAGVDATQAGGHVTQKTHGRTHWADATGDDAVEGQRLRDSLRHAAAARSDRVMDGLLLDLA